MSPLEKWQYRKVFPWKMIFQIIKIFTVTTQILLFGFDCSQFYSEQMATETALKVNMNANNINKSDYSAVLLTLYAVLN